jgi:hypothetical protein
VNLLQERKNRVLIQSDSLRGALHQQCNALAGVAGLVEQGFNFGRVGYNVWNGVKPLRRSRRGLRFITVPLSLLRLARRFLS